MNQFGLDFTESIDDDAAANSVLNKAFGIPRAMVVSYVGNTL